MGYFEDEHKSLWITEMSGFPYEPTMMNSKVKKLDQFSWAGWAWISHWIGEQAYDYRRRIQLFGVKVVLGLFT